MAVWELASLFPSRELMHRSLTQFRVLGAFISTAAALSLANNVSAIGTYVLNEKFNDMPTNSAPTAWTSTTTNGSVAVKEYPFAADKSVRIEKFVNTATGEASISRTFANQSGKVAFEAKVMTRLTSGFKAIPYIYNTSGAVSSAVVSVGFDNGNIISYVGATKTTIQPFVANDWYMIRVVINTATNTYDLFIDGVRKLNNVALRNNAPSLGKLSFYMDGDNTGILYVDNVKVFELGSYIGSAPGPIFDVRNAPYNAIGNGTTNDTAAIQHAIDDCTGTGGSVYLGGTGTFVTGMLRLKSNMTFFIDTAATLKGSLSGFDYPKQNPPTSNNQLLNCRRALLYAESVTNLKIDGGGTIDGSGVAGYTNDGFRDVPWTEGGIKEAERPITIWTVVSDHVTIQNIYIRLSAMWTIVPMETDYLTIKNVLLNVDIDPNRDGIDLVDCHHALVQDCTVYTDDDSFCPKTGVRRGVEDLVIKDCFSAHTGANSYKFGTATYGGFKDVLIQDCYAKNATYAAMVVMSRNGAEVNNINFSRLEFSNCGSAFFIFLGQQTGHPDGDVDKLGFINNVHFTDILCSQDNSTSNIWGSLITGQIYNGTTYPITNLFFTNCNITFKGGRNSVPGNPAEWNSSQYPEANMFGDLPGYGYYLRHVNGVTFTNCTSRLNGSDARPLTATNDSTAPIIRTDSDFDGVPNDWEQQYPSAAAPDADADGDGVTNYGEFVAGTDPTNPSDHLMVTNTFFEGSTVTLTFRAVPLKRYQPEYTDDIVSGTWTSLGNIRAADSNTLIVTDSPGAGVASRMYRLRVLID
jgi:polygalacturonase